MDIIKNICEKCKRELSYLSFMKTCGGKRQLVDGTIKEYRDSICRKCRRIEKIAAGRCLCGRPLQVGCKQCESCLKTIRDGGLKRRRNDRLAALAHYGSDCAYCGENLEVFLTIDHVNNDGAEHRRKNRFHIGGWLRKNNYPSGFQILCFNCNCAKSRLGEAELIRLLKAAGRLRLDFVDVPNITDR